MFTDPDHCYEALASHDARFDGRFFVGVRTTGIYCRPVCRVRLPKRENCRFYPSAAAAEQAGHRPCLRCRPELAPGWAPVDIEARLAHAGARLIESGRADIAGIAARLGVTERHFRRIFADAFGVSPMAYRQTHRLLLAKQLLGDTALSVIDVALASGFGSVRRLNAVLQERYGMTPTALRRSRRSNDNGRHDRDTTAPERIELLLRVHAPCDTAALFSMLAREAIASVEVADSCHHARVVTIETPDGAVSGVIETRRASSDGDVRLSVSPALLAVVSDVLALACDLYDVRADSGVIDAVLGSLAADRPGRRVPGVANGFEGFVRLLLSNPVDRSRRHVTGSLPDRHADVLDRLVQICGQPIETAVPGLSRCFPLPLQIIALGEQGLHGCGMDKSTIHALLTVAELCREGRLLLAPSVPVDDTLSRLREVDGIDADLLDLVAMRILRWPDAFPAGDRALQQAMGVDSRAHAIDLATAWQPWRAYAAMHLQDRQAGTCPTAFDHKEAT